MGPLSAICWLHYGYSIGSTLNRLNPNLPLALSEMHQKWNDVEIKEATYELLQLVDINVSCDPQHITNVQTTRQPVQQVSYFVYQRSDQMADSHCQRHFESSHCISKLLPSDL